MISARFAVYRIVRRMSDDGRIARRIAIFGADDGRTFIDGDIVDSFFLMVVLIWIQTGFAMVILSAALRGVPEDTIEAAIVDNRDREADGPRMGHDSHTTR